MSQQNPWRTLSSSIPYSNRWITIRENQVIQPDGHRGIYGVVHMVRAVAVVAVDDNGDIFLVGQYRYTTDRYSWEVIAGGVEPGESILQAGERELKEEAGIVAGKWTQLGEEIDLFNSVCDQRGDFYLAEELELSQATPEPTEQIILKRFSVKETLEMLESGMIHDAYSIIALMRYFRRANVYKF